MTYTTFNQKSFDTLKQPMFFGETVNVARYDIQKHKIFENLIEKSKKEYYQALMEGQKNRGKDNENISRANTVLLVKRKSQPVLSAGGGQQYSRRLSWWNGLQ